MKKISLYIHIPFCQQKCYYCDFSSFVLPEQTMNKYIKYLIKEISIEANNHCESIVTTIFIGGGTPSILTKSLIIKLFDAINEKFRIHPKCEITIEVNPGTVSLDLYKTYLELGINRISMGGQTFDDQLLKKIGRIHTKREFINSFLLAEKAGFKNISLDLMLGLPGQTMQLLEKDIEIIKKLSPKHVSAYGLKIEENTVFHNMLQQGEIIIPDESVERRMYYYIRDELESIGIQQYELSNFAKAGFECRHNIVYWHNEEYIGIGLGAHGRIEDKRIEKVDSLNDYFRLLDHGQRPIKSIETISKEIDIFETIFMNMRLTSGYAFSRFNKRFGLDFEKVYKKEILELQNKGLIEISNGKIRLTKKGMDYSNQVFMMFCEF